MCLLIHWLGGNMDCPLGGWLKTMLEIYPMVNDSNMCKTLVQVWIHGVLKDDHLNKWFGESSEAFNEMGSETLIVLEKSNLSVIPPYMEVIELGLSHSPLRELKTLPWIKLLRVIWFESPHYGDI